MYRIEYQGKIYNASQLSKILGVKRDTIVKRYKNNEPLGTRHPRYNCPHIRPIGSERIWHGKGSNIIYVKVGDAINKREKNWVPKTKLMYCQYHQNETLESLNDYVIMQLDRNMYNFEKENLVKVYRPIYLLMCAGKMLYDEPILNKESILINTLIYETKQKEKNL